MKKLSLPVIIVLIMALISFVCLTLSVSYSYVFGSKAANNTQVIKAGNLDASIDYTPIDLKLEPMYDEEGLYREEFSTITVNKNNQYTVYYNIALGYDDSITGRPLDELLPLEYIKVALFSIEDESISEYPIVGPVAIGDLPLLKSDDNISNDFYSLTFGTFAPGTNTTTFALKTWLEIDLLESDIIDEFNDAIANLSAKIIQEPLFSKNIYNLLGTVNLDGEPVENFCVSLQNGLRTYDTNIEGTTDGTYALGEVVEGTYNLTVTLESGDIYETTVNIRPGSTVSVSENATDPGASGTYIQQSAYKYYTTPLKIIKYNSLTTNSNEITTVEYNIPKSYSITGGESIATQELNGININLTSEGEISLTNE